MSRHDGRKIEAALWIAVLALVCGLLLGAVSAKLREKRERQTMSDMRSAATAVVSFSVDENRYPEQHRLAPIRGRMIRLLEGTYIKTLPVRDAWGEPILYWSNGWDFVLVSTGHDRKLAADVDAYLAEQERHPHLLGDDIFYPGPDPDAPPRPEGY